MLVNRPKLIISGPIFELYTYRSTQVLFNDYVKDEEYKRKKSRQGLIRSINANAGQWYDTSNRPFVSQFYTFTFANPPDSVGIASGIFHKFIKRLTYAIFSTKKAVLKYTTVIEFQEKRGVKYGIEPPIHYHTLFYNLPYIQHIKKIYIDPAWQQGFTFARSVENVSNAGQYLAKYMAKSDRDHRLFQKKSYFSSKGLLKPIILNNEFTIADYLSLIDKVDVGYNFVSDDMEYRMYNLSFNNLRYIPQLVRKMKEKELLTYQQVIHKTIQQKLL